MECNAFLDESKIRNSDIQNSTIGNCAIITSSLDMNMQRITNVANPINPQDAATRDYIDIIGTSHSINLTGTGWSLVTSIYLKGAIDIAISNMPVNGPCANFKAVKSEPTRSSNIVRIVSSPGSTTLEQLEVRWMSNTGIEIHKTNVNYDGIYKVKIYGGL
jgi:hypothetical protein